MICIGHSTVQLLGTTQPNRFEETGTAQYRAHRTADAIPVPHIDLNNADSAYVTPSASSRIDSDCMNG